MPAMEKNVLVLRYFAAALNLNNLFPNVFITSNVSRRITEYPAALIALFLLHTVGARHVPLSTGELLSVFKRLFIYFIYLTIF